MPVISPVKHTIRVQKDDPVGDNTEPTIQQDANQLPRRNSRQEQGDSAAADELDQLSLRLEAKLPRFGPICGKDNKANQVAKSLAWNHICKPEQDIADAYYSSFMKIEEKAIASYDTSVTEKLKPGSEFREMMVKDGCFFLQVALSILGGGEHLEYGSQNPYFGKDKDCSQWIPAMFFVGNQIPYVVIRELMKQTFFQNVIKQGVQKGTWGHPPDDFTKLVLYQTVVEPELKQPVSGIFSKWKRLPTRALYQVVVEPEPEPKPKPKPELKQTVSGFFSKWKKPPPSPKPPNDILHYLHSMFLGPESNNPTYSKMKEFPDLEANRVDNDINFPSAREIIKRGIRLRKAKDGITNIKFQNLLFFARLNVPPLTIESNTEHVLKSLTSYEQNMNKSDREVTAYLCFMRDLAPTYEDFKILKRRGIIQIKDKESKYRILRTINDLVASQGNLTLKFRHIKRKTTEYERPPWGVISIIFGLFTIVQTIFAVLPYIKATK